MRSIAFLLGTTLAGAFPSSLHAQQVSTEALPNTLPDAPGLLDPTTGLPLAVEIPAKQDASAASAKISAHTQTSKDDVFTLDGNVVLRYRGYILKADHIEYNQVTQDLTATGHLQVNGSDDELINASHATMNLETGTGEFFDVTGSVGMHNSGDRVIYTSGNPFLFGGQRVVKTGPKSFHVYRGWVTTCQLPKPDWQLFSGHIEIDDGKARMRNSIFKLGAFPLLYLPFVTHPVDPEERQSGIWTPVIGQSSTKGIVLGEEFYFVLNRSADLTVGVQYYSLRGWEESASLRYVGHGNDFARLRYNGLVDRGYIQSNGGYTNQGGEDVSFSGRHDFNAQTRAVVNMEYLSSYVYREAFSGSFNQAVSSDLTSVAYLAHQWNGFSADLRGDRYQGLKRVPIPATPTFAGTAGQQVRILRIPSLDFSAVDHPLKNSQFFWNVEGSATGLKRSQPNFVTGGTVERYDLHPQIGYRLNGGGWQVLPTLALRDTVYSRSRAPALSPVGNPIQDESALNRADLEVRVDVRAPVVERTFHTPALKNILGTELRHTIEPAFTYRNVHGVDNFADILRFDDIDVVSDTHEVEYGVTQHLYARGGDEKPCPGAVATEGASGAASADGSTSVEDIDALPDLNADAGFGMDPDAPLRTGKPVKNGCTPAQKEWISWRLTQKYFIDKDFGNAVQLGRRNIFTSTLDLSGVAFLTEPREISPLISRLRIRTTNNVDVEWDFDLDTGAKRFTGNNIFLDAHAGNWFTAMSYARLNAPGRAYVLGVNSSVSNFSQLRLLAGYGQPTKRGLSMAANAGYDLNLGGLQYSALQASYNWDCCGLSVEYRKFELGSVRNEGTYRFNFTLANIGAAGNLRRAERLF